MKKIEDIGNKDIFKVPDGYFETFPSVIQTRIAKQEDSWMPFLIPTLKYALPILVISIIGLFWFFKSNPVNPEDILASVDTKDIADYLADMEINNDDLLNLLDYNAINADSLDLKESHILNGNETDLTDLWIELETEI